MLWKFLNYIFSIDVYCKTRQTDQRWQVLVISCNEQGIRLDRVSSFYWKEVNEVSDSSEVVRCFAFHELWLEPWVQV